MNKMPISPRYESAEYCGYEFDYHQDFTQFLEEARKSTFQETTSTAHLEPATKKQSDGEIKNKKSWKRSFFSWLMKTDRKSKSTKPQTNGMAVSKAKHGYVSGPIQGIKGGISSGRAEKAASGPLTRVFTSTRRVEKCEVPYMCLGQLDTPRKIYGPVYLVA